MNEVQNQIFKMDTTYIKDNEILAMSINRQDVDRCSRIIREYGLLTPPVVGNFKDGTQLVLFGECEFTALKEMGVKKVDAISVPIIEDEDGNKLALLLSGLKRNPNALSEAILIEQLIKTGKYTQIQLAEMLGKSTSWINKRISLVTKLNPAVREMVTMKQLCPHSAQEISRLPQEAQYGFSTKVVTDGLPKSAVETLVATFNNQDCPSALKEQILDQPRHALSKLEQYQVKTIRDPSKKEHTVSNKTLRNDLVLLIRCIKDIEEQLGAIEQETISQLHEIFKSARSVIVRFLSLLEIILRSTEVSLGKLQGEVN